MHLMQEPLQVAADWSFIAKTCSKGTCSKVVCIKTKLSILAVNIILLRHALIRKTWKVSKVNQDSFRFLYFALWSIQKTHAIL